MPRLASNQTVSSVTQIPLIDHQGLLQSKAFTGRHRLLFMPKQHNVLLECLLNWHWENPWSPQIMSITPVQTSSHPRSSLVPTILFPWSFLKLIKHCQLRNSCHQGRREIPVFQVKNLFLVLNSKRKIHTDSGHLWLSRQYTKWCFFKIANKFHPGSLASSNKPWDQLGELRCSGGWDDMDHGSACPT